MNNLSLLIACLLITTSLFAQTAGTKWVKSHFYLEGKKQEFRNKVLKKAKTNSLMLCTDTYRLSTSVQKKACVGAVKYSIDTYLFFYGKYNNPNQWYKRKNFVEVYQLALEECDKKFDHDKNDPFWVNPSKLKACKHGAKYLLDSVVGQSKNMGLHGEGNLECGALSCEIK